MIRLFSIIWFLIGSFLLIKGLYLIQGATTLEWASVLIAISLFVGLIKGRLILAKAGKRAAIRLSHPTPIWKLYSRRDIILIVCMIALGILMRAFHVPHLIRGPILVAVGFALFQGAIAALRVRDKIIN